MDLLFERMLGYCSSFRCALSTLITGALLLCPGFASGQRSEVKKHYQYERYKEAVEAFEQLDTGSVSTQDRYYAAISYLHGYSYTKGLSYLRAAIADDPNIGGKDRIYWLGLAYHFNKKYAQAIQLLEVYKSKVSKATAEATRVDRWLQAADYASRLPVANSVSEYKLVPLSTINSPFREHSPTVSSDGNTLYFTRRGENTTGGKRDKDGGFMEDILVAHRTDGFQWSEPQNLEGINSVAHDATVTLFDNDSKFMIYHSKRQGDFYICEKEGEGWSQPKPFAKGVNSKDYEAHACFSQDGQLLIFSSNREYGDLDLFFSTKGENGKWSKPKPIENLNTLADEDAPFLSEDKQRLYFASRGHNSMGGYDLFCSYWNEGSQSWGKPENLGGNFNSPQDDIFLIFDAKEDHGFVASSRAGGEGDLDIYEVSRLYHVEVEGVVINTFNDRPLPNVNVQFYHEKTEKVFAAMTDSEGRYRLTMPSGYNFPAKLMTLAPNMESEVLLEDSLVIAPVAQKGKSLTRNFEVEKAIASSNLVDFKVVGKVQTLEGREPAEGKLLLRSLAQKQKLKNIIVDTQGNFEATVKAVPNSILAFDFEVSDGRTFSNVYTLESRMDTTASLPIFLDEALNPPFYRDSALLAFDQGKSIRVSSLVFDYKSSELSDGMKKELDRIIELQRGFDNVAIQITGHSYGFDPEQSDLSQQRVLNAIQYLENKGVGKQEIYYGYYDVNHEFRDRAPSGIPNMANPYIRRLDIRLAPRPY